MSKEESKYGFKDKERAVESLKLLETEDLSYQKLTVRGLLGRAKRVLGMTKNEEKVKNISSAIEVFEEWLGKNGSDPAATKNAKPTDETRPETVPGLGFKDPEAARKTLEVLEGRDPAYQKLSINSLIVSSKRVLRGTKNEDKIKAITEAAKILEDFLEKFDSENRQSENKAYLPHEVLGKLTKLPKCKLTNEFIEVYTATKNYKFLRTQHPKKNSAESKSWDIIRNRELGKLKVPSALFKENGEPTEGHLELIYWAYSPQPAKVKAFYEGAAAPAEKSTSSKRHSSEADSSSASPAKKKR